ncbi:MAG: O-antigen ligase family protein [Lewinellaceae bacterium]|nr:O-antigen ligase family protein [Lewinellaceae bacterium]
MLRRLASILSVPERHPQGWPLAVFVVVSVATILAAVGLEAWWMAGIPAVLAVLWLVSMDMRKVFLLLLASLPLSMEQALPGGLATDFPSEQLMWLLTLTGGMWLVQHWRTLDARFLRHPVTIALLLHLAWITVCASTSQDFFISFKYWLAKGWYVIVFFFLAGHYLNEERDFKNFLWWFFLPLLFAVSVVITRHAAIGFSFEEVGFVMGPFFRNHVTYACVLAIFLPFVWYGTYWYRRYSRNWWLLVSGIALFIVGINFAYTRAAYVALLAAVGISWIIRRKLLRVTLLVVVVTFTLIIGFVSNKDNWLQFAPEYEKAVTHVRFDRLLDATTKLEDISTMERVYRWVAASYMIQDRPLVGFGPGTFYFFYKKYTVTSFKTYVSNNPERSGIHNYFLMVTVEQGLPGLLFFLIFSAVVMLKGEQIYHRTRDAGRRRVLMSALLCFILIDLLMLMNDLVETDKVGSFFFMSAAILINIDLKNRDLEASGHAGV